MGRPRHHFYSPTIIGLKKVCLVFSPEIDGREKQECGSGRGALGCMAAQKYREIYTCIYIVEEKNKEITSSLRYAKRLQEALLPPKNLLDSFFNDNYFILYNPRDIVCGDFYWARQIKTSCLF